MLIHNEIFLKAIIDWLREELSIRVTKISSYEEVEKNWLQNNSSGPNEVTKKVKVLLLTQLLHPPLFLAALSTKFSGNYCVCIRAIKLEESVLMYFMYIKIS